MKKKAVFKQEIKCRVGLNFIHRELAGSLSEMLLKRRSNKVQKDKVQFWGEWVYISQCWLYNSQWMEKLAIARK